MKSKLLNSIRIGAALPIIFGSLVFSVWYFMRVFHAKNVEIEVMAGMTILAYLLIGAITVILCIIYVRKKRDKWRDIIIPLFVILLTIPVISVFYSVHSSFQEQAFVKLINDSEGVDIIRLRSDHFERTYFDNEDDTFIISYYPVYTYDWTQAASGDWYSHYVNKVTIELKLKNDSRKIYDFPEFSKGDCGVVRLSEIMNE